MSRRFVAQPLSLAVALCLFVVSSAGADQPKDVRSKDAKPDQVKAEPQQAAPGAPSVPVAAPQAKPKFPPYADVLSGATAMEGFIKLHRKDTKLLAELSPGDLDKDVMVAIAISRGIGQTPLLGGMTWGFGDDWVWQFRKADDRIQIVRRNVRFRAAKGSPQERSVHFAYTDSIMFSLPIVTTGPNGSFVVDLTPVFMSDLPQISAVLPGFGFAGDRSTWAQVKAFRDNVEIEVAATYASGGGRSIDTVADSRGATLYVHYSVSRLPETGYQPRLADDRVGYFLTALKDYSRDGEEDRFIRYVNRWDLRKAEPSAAVSPPVKPLVFWIEKTVPFKYRAAVREGILEWNKAYEKAGFANAIEVRQQPDDATWDPEDISYNTFRWITSSASFAMGPSRVNPLTGQILDADIIFDADFIERWQDYFETERRDAATVALPTTVKLPGLPADPRHNLGDDGDYTRMLGQDLAFGAMALAAPGHPVSKEKLDELFVAGVKSVVTHEVGHTLGLRHNFKSSAYWTMAELNDPEKTKNVGLTASIMDYMPVNISPKGKPQGDYFSRTIGPYDYWAIEYGYKPFSGGTDGEVAELKKIASRSAEPALDYATDGDADGGPDPLVNRHDLSKDTVEFARWRVELINQLMPKLIDDVVAPGEGYQRVRKAFDMLLHQHGIAMGFVSRQIGGIYVNRDHKGDPNARPPLVLVEAAKQRAALEFLEQQVFGPEAYQFPTKLYGYLAPPHWDHWGMRDVRADFPVHNMILGIQDSLLGRLLSPTTLSRLLDSELKAPPEQDLLTASELVHRLTSSIFREVETLEKAKDAKFTARKPAIDSRRRNLQQRYFERLADMAMGNGGAPSECQTMAVVELKNLEPRLNVVAGSVLQLDDATRQHLSDLAARTRKVLNARINLQRP